MVKDTYFWYDNELLCEMVDPQKCVKSCTEPSSEVLINTNLWHAMSSIWTRARAKFWSCTAQKIEFSIKDFFRKYDQIRRKQIVQFSSAFPNWLFMLWLEA